MRHKHKTITTTKNPIRNSFVYSRKKKDSAKKILSKRTKKIKRKQEKEV